MSRKSSGLGPSSGVDGTKYGVGERVTGVTSLPVSFYGNGAYTDDFEGDGVDVGGGSAKADTDAMTVHRRKMMRRAANRRSAQLSRARKKVSCTCCLSYLWH